MFRWIGLFVPALDPGLYEDLLKAGFSWSDQLGDWDGDGVPVWFQIFFDDFCCGCGDVCAILSDFEEFKVGVALIPKVKDTVRIHQLDAPPLHGQRRYITNNITATLLDLLNPHDHLPRLLLMQRLEREYRCLVPGPDQRPQIRKHPPNQLLITTIIIVDFDLDLLSGLEDVGQFEAFLPVGVDVVGDYLGPADLL